MCNVTSKLANICNRMQSSKIVKIQIIVKYGCHVIMHFILEEVCIACNYCYFQHPEESLSEIGSAVTVHHSSPSATSFLPQWRVLIFVEIQWQLQTG